MLEKLGGCYTNLKATHARLVDEAEQAKKKEDSMLVASLQKRIDELTDQNVGLMGSLMSQSQVSNNREKTDSLKARCKELTGELTYAIEKCEFFEKELQAKEEKIVSLEKPNSNYNEKTPIDETPELVDNPLVADNQIDDLFAGL